MTKPLEEALDRAMEKAGFVPRRAISAPLHTKGCLFVQCQDCDGWVHWCREPVSAPQKGPLGEDVYVRCERCDAVRTVVVWAKNPTTPCPEREK